MTTYVNLLVSFILKMSAIFKVSCKLNNYVKERAITPAHT